MTVSFAAAFVGGFLSFISPCVLPLVPAYISYISGVSVEELSAGAARQSSMRAGLRSLFFVLGFSLVFITMGASASSIGQVYAEHRQVLMKIGGIVIVVFGLHMLGVFRIQALYAEKRFHVRMKNVGYLGAFLLGLVFAFGWTPCVGLYLAPILALAADTETLGRGVALLAVYSLGLGLPFVLTGFLTSRAIAAMNRIKPHFRKVEVVSGLLLMVVGILIFTGDLQKLSGYLPSLLPS